MILATVTLLAVSAAPASADHIKEGDVRIKVTCKYSHSLADDPIVFPNQPGAAHLHDYFGNENVDASTTTFQALQAAPSDTTCNNKDDLASYWAPAVYFKTVTMSSGAPDSAHADFFNGWVADELQSLVDKCLNALVRCESLVLLAPPTGFEPVSPP